MFGDEDDDESEGGGGFQLLLAAIAILGLAAVAFSFVGLYTVLTGGTGGDDVATLPEGFGCDTFNGDPDVGHEAAYGITRNATLIAFTEITETTADNGFELRFNVSDPSVLNSSARQADGSAVDVDVQNTTVVVADNDTSPFRLWIDSARGGTITRSELDICPPQTDDN